MKKSIAVLGLGKFGRSLVRTLSSLGADVLAVDREETIVKEMADLCSEAVCANLASEESLIALGLKDMDVVVVAVGRNLEASIFAVSVAKEQGVPLVVAKSDSPRMSAILRKIGADKVIIPEEYAGNRTAVTLVSEAVLSYFQVDDSLCIIEMKPHSDWIGKNIDELNIRRNYHANVLAEKNEDGKWVMVDPDHPLQEDTKLLVLLNQKDLGRFK